MYLRDTDLMKMLSESEPEACVFAPSTSGKHYARRALKLREGAKPFAGAVCRHLCPNDSSAERTCIKHTTWGTISENLKDARDTGRVLPPAHLWTQEVRARAVAARTGQAFSHRGRPLSTAHKDALSGAAKSRALRQKPNPVEVCKKMIAEAHAYDAGEKL